MAGELVCIQPHGRFLDKPMSSEKDICALYSTILPKASHTRPHESDLFLKAFQMIPIETYNVHVNMVQSVQTVVFKLINEEIEALVGFHKYVCSLDCHLCSI